MDKEEFGRKLTESRKNAGLSRDDVVKRASVSLSALAAYERGEKMPPMEIAIRIADILGVSLDWLAGREPTKEHKLETWEDAINAMGILLVDIPNIKIVSYPHYYEYKNSGWEETTHATNDVCNEHIIRIPFENPNNEKVVFPADACEVMEKILPLVKKDNLTREQFIVLVNSVAKKHNQAMNP